MRELESVKILRFNSMNRNRRMYTQDEFHMQKEIIVGADKEGDIVYETMSIMEDLKRMENKNILCGQLGFPPGNHDEVITGASLIDATHLIKNIRIEEDYLLGDIKLIKSNDIDKYKTLKSLVKNGWVCFRTRATGNIRLNDTVDLHKIIAIDAVSKNNDSFYMEESIKRHLVTEKKLMEFG